MRITRYEGDLKGGRAKMKKARVPVSRNGIVSTIKKESKYKQAKEKAFRKLPSHVHSTKETSAETKSTLLELSKHKKRGSSNKTEESKCKDDQRASDTNASQSTLGDTVNIVYKHAYEDPNWLGNEDETGSVASGVLEEDFCCECGASTLETPETWSNVILCDICDGEYHLKCIGLKSLPENYICRRCLKEQDHLYKLNFNLTDTFPVESIKDINRRAVYTPARPLAAAWQECVKKGLMVVSEVFSYEILT